MGRFLFCGARNGLQRSVRHIGDEQHVGRNTLCTTNRRSVTRGENQIDASDTRKRTKRTQQRSDRVEGRQWRC